MSKETMTEAERLQAEVNRLKGVNTQLHGKCVAQAARIAELQIVVDNYASMPSNQDINDARMFRMWFGCGAHTELPTRLTLDEWRDRLMADLQEMI